MGLPFQFPAWQEIEKGELKERRFYPFLGNGFAQILRQIVPERVKKLSDVNLLALRYIKWHKTSLPVDVCRSKWRDRKYIRSWDSQDKLGQWRIQGRGQGDPAPLIFRPNWGPEGAKTFGGRPPPPLYLWVWITGPPLSQGLHPAL